MFQPLIIPRQYPVVPDLEDLQSRHIPRKYLVYSDVSAPLQMRLRKTRQSAMRVRRGVIRAETRVIPSHHGVSSDNSTSKLPHGNGITLQVQRRESTNEAIVVVGNRRASEAMEAAHCENGR